MSAPRASGALQAELAGSRRAGAGFGVPASGRAVAADCLGQQLAWWWCVLLARDGHTLAALAAPALYSGVHLLARPRARLRLAALASGGAALGWLGDTLLLRAGLLSFPGSGDARASSPAFMVALWAMFALSLSASAAPLSRLSPAALAALAALAGPLAYLGGARLSFLSLADGALPAVALEWALLATLLVSWSRRLLKPSDEPVGGD